MPGGKLESFEVQVGVGRVGDGELIPVSATVDTGAPHSVMPESLLRGLGVSPAEYHTFTDADGGKVECGYGVARFVLDGREYPCPVVFGPEGQYMLGVTSLQIFNLQFDPPKENLIAKPLRLTPVNGRDGVLALKGKSAKSLEPRWVKDFLSPSKNRRKMNPVLAWLLISAKVVVFALRYGGSKDAWVNYDTGELYPVEE